MEKQENKYKYSQLEIYKESLELAHMKRKTVIVNILLVVLAGLLVYFLIAEGIDKNIVYSALLMFTVLLLINALFYSFDQDLYNNLKLAMYITILGIYSIAIMLILNFLTPSIFTVLFLAYAVTSIYQDYKSMLLSSSALFISGSLLIVGYPEIFTLVGNTDPQTFYALIFLSVFVLLLTLSSYILIKRKTFFYNQLASIKESEVRNMELMMEVEFIKKKKTHDYSGYYDDLLMFSKELSKKIGIDNIFMRKIQILKDLRTSTPGELVEKYSEYTLEELENMRNMEIEVHQKMKKIGTKASKSNGIEVNRKEIFSESQFKSFNHYDDSKYAKIISFAVFYTLLKIQKPYLEELEEDKIKDILYNSEYFYRVDRDIINIYLNNNEVFDTIVKDYMKGGW